MPRPPEHPLVAAVRERMPRKIYEDFYRLTAYDAYHAGYGDAMDMLEKALSERSLLDAADAIKALMKESPSPNPLQL